MNRLTRRLCSAAAATLAAAVVAGPATPASAGGTVFLDSALSINRQAGTVTLPMYRGMSHGQTVWYVLTESSNKEQAERLGINTAEKLTNALGTRAVQRARGDVRHLTFDDTVDFSPTRVVVPGPTGFPPKQAVPGARGIGAYSPLVTPDGHTVFNATHVANASGQHDAVVAIDYGRRRVTLDTFNGFYDGKPIQYLHQEGSIELIAAIEGSTFAPNLNAAPRVADQSRDTSARAAIFPIVNGPLGVNNPERQGLQSALLGQGDPLNITSEEPDSNDYSPVWDIHPAVWTPAAIRAGERERLTSDEQITSGIKHGELTSGGAGPRNEDFGGIRALPAISNCPIVLELN